MERGASLRQRAESREVSEHLRERNRAPDQYGVAEKAGLIHERPPAAEVLDDRSEVFLRRADLEIHDRLENRHPRATQRLAEPEGGRGVQGDLRLPLLR